MPTYARKHQLQRSLIYHVYNRSNERRFIFNDESDYRYFKNLLAVYSLNFALRIYHWVIMANHYHLLLEIDEPEKISAAMAGLNLSYTHYHHKKYQGGGFLWQGRFKAQPVQRENYLLACGRYIERNPVRAGIVMEASEYVFSSARYYCLGEKDGITVESPSFAQFGLENISRRKAYISFLRDFNREVEGQFAALDNPVGDKEFIKRLISLDGRFMPRRRGRPAKDLLRNHLALR